MKYELHYNGVTRPTEREVLDMVLAVTRAAGTECESVEFVHDAECTPTLYFLIPNEPDDTEAWKT